MDKVVKLAKDEMSLKFALLNAALNGENIRKEGVDMLHELAGELKGDEKMLIELNIGKALFTLAAFHGVLRAAASLRCWARALKQPGVKIRYRELADKAKEIMRKAHRLSSSKPYLGPRIKG